MGECCECDVLVRRWRGGWQWAATSTTSASRQEKVNQETYYTGVQTSLLLMLSVSACSRCQLCYIYFCFNIWDFIHKMWIVWSLDTAAAGWEMDGWWKDEAGYIL